jgi:hypothetical protein
MASVDSFVRPEHLEDFTRPGRRLPRSTIEVSLEDPDARPDTQTPLEDAVLQRLQKTTALGSAFGCVCVQVRRGDGMSWGAEAISRAVREKLGHLPRWHVAKTLVEDALPAIARVVGVGPFLKLAVTEKLTTSFITLRSWVTPAIIGGAVLAGAAIKIYEVWKGGMDLTAPRGYAVAVGVAALGLAAQYLTTLLTTRTTSKSIEAFCDRLDEKRKTLAYANFVEGLAKMLTRLSFPRVVIVDDFEGLDPTTRQVVQRYFESHAREVSGALELWVVLDSTEGGTLSQLAVSNREGFAFSRTSIVRQRLLTEAEKRDLAQLIGKPERAGFTTVKQICAEGEKTGSEIHEQLRAYRMEHPRKPLYGELELLHLIALTMLPEPIPLTRRFLVNRLSEKEGLRPALLRQLLPGTTATKDEYRVRLDSLTRAMAGMLEIEETPEGARLQVATEAATALVQMSDQLDLPSPGLGHVFWSLFWHDLRLKQGPEPYWIRKVTSHLVAMDVSLIADAESRAQASRQLVDVILTTVDASLAACLFGKVVDLLEQALSLLQSDDLPADGPSRRRFLRECWKAYSILGDERLLTWILDLVPDAWPPRQAAVEEGELILERLFLQSITVAPERRDTLESRGERKTGTYAVESAADHAKVRAAWLALTGATIMYSREPLDLRAAAEAALESIDTLTRRTWDRLARAPEESIRVLDALTFSLALWCHALRLSPVVVRGAGGELNPFIALARFNMLLERAQEAVSLAGDLRKESSASGPATAPRRIDFILNAQARELCAMAIASVVMGYHHVKEWGLDAVEPTWHGRFRDIVTSVTALLSHPLPRIESIEDATSPALAKSVGDLITMCRIVWNHFELDRLRDFLNARRIEFTAAARRLRPEDHQAYRPLQASVAITTERGGFPALMATLVLAVCLRAAQELSAHYVTRVAAIALAGQFGDRLKDELAYLAIRRAHVFHWPLDPFVARVVEGRAGRPPFAATALGASDHLHVGGSALSLLNAAFAGARPLLHDQMLAIVESTAEAMDDGAAKEELLALRDFFRLRDDIRAGRSLEPDALLKQWERRHDLWVYAAVLDQLIGRGYASEGVRAEAFRILDRNPDDDTYSVYFHLARKVAGTSGTKPDGPEQVRRAGEYLKASLPRWESSLAAEANLDAYRILYGFDPPRRVTYMEEIEKWQSIKIQRDHLQRLPHLIEAGSFFLVFQDYVDSMRFWGLQADIPAAELVEGLSADPERHAALAREWKAAGGDVPAPLLRAGAATVVASRYLLLGRALFSPPCDRDTVFDDDRQRFDAAAKSRLKPLINTIIALPNLPAAIKDLLDTHAHRLLEHTLPRE